MEDAAEMWGTFAVDDHRRQKAFVAETILFDRLVIPVPPDEDDARLQKWEKEGWDPRKLSEIVKRLEDLAVPLPWGEAREAEWRTAYDERFPKRKAEQRFRLAENVKFDVAVVREADSPSRIMSRFVLVNALNPAYDTLIYEQMSRLELNPADTPEVMIGYGSFSNFQRDIPLHIGPHQPGATHTGSDSKAKLDANLLARWNFLVPDDTGLTNEHLLSKAVKLSRHSEFRDSRREFHSWRRKLLKHRATVEQATAEMERCLKVYTGIIAKRKRRNAVRTALQVLAATVPLADFAVDHLGSVSAVAFGVGSIVADQLLQEPTLGTREKCGALVYDSRKAFGWKDR